MRKNLKSYAISTPQHGDVAIITAHGPMQAASMVRDTLIGPVLDEHEAEQLMREGWPSDEDVREINADELGAYIIDRRNT